MSQSKKKGPAMTSDKKLKVFIWTSVLHDYTSGMAVAIAPDYVTALKSFEFQHIRDDLSIDNCKIIDLKDVPDDYTFSDYVYGGG